MLTYYKVKKILIKLFCSGGSAVSCLFVFLVGTKGDDKVNPCLEIQRIGSCRVMITHLLNDYGTEKKNYMRYIGIKFSLLKVQTNFSQSFKNMYKKS